jgi:uncharacterized protein
MAKEMSTIDWIAMVLVIIGALNWGLLAIDPRAELIQYLSNEILIRVVYGLVGLSGLWALYTLFK